MAQVSASRCDSIRIVSKELGQGFFGKFGGGRRKGIWIGVSGPTRKNKVLRDLDKIFKRDLSKTQKK